VLLERCPGTGPVGSIPTLIALSALTETVLGTWFFVVIAPGTHYPPKQR